MQQEKNFQLEEENKCLREVVHIIKLHIHEIQKKIDILDLKNIWYDPNYLQINLPKYPPIPSSPLHSPINTPLLTPISSCDDDFVDKIACAGGDLSIVNENLSLLFQSKDKKWIEEAKQEIQKICILKRNFTHPKKSDTEVLEFHFEHDKNTIFSLYRQNEKINCFNFDIFFFKEKCNKKELLFIKNLILIDSTTYSFEKFPFSTFFTICDLLSKQKVLKYDMSFVNITIYTGSGNFMQLSHTKKYFSLEDCVFVKQLFESINMFKLF